MTLTINQEKFFRKSVQHKDAFAAERMEKFERLADVVYKYRNFAQETGKKNERLVLIKQIDALLDELGWKKKESIG